MHIDRFVRSTTLPGLLMSVVVAVLALHAVRPASAQTRLPLPDFSGFFVPEYRMNDLETLIEGLGVRPEQEVIVETLLSDYELAFVKGVNETRARITELRPLPDDVTAEGRRATEAVRQELQEVIQAFREAREAGDAQLVEQLKQRLRELRERSREQLSSLQPEPMAPEQTRKVGNAIVGELLAWREAREVLRSDFSNGLLTVLDEDQKARWPAVERRLRRDRELTDARLAGEAVDLIAYARDLPLTAAGAQQVAPVLDAYARELDEALRRRRAYLEDAKFELYRAAMAADPARGETVVDRELELRLEVRAINERYAAEIAASLPDAGRAAFLEAVRLDMMPRIYRPTRTWRKLTAAANLEGLTEPQRESVLELLSEYRDSYAEATERIREVTLEHEPALERLRMLHRYGLQPPGSDTGAAETIQGAFQERADLDRAYEDRLKAILGEEHFGRLPG